MSLKLGKLCSVLLLEHFGPIVQTVADDLFKNGPKSLGFILFTTKLPMTKIKESLCVLIKYGFVYYEKSGKGMVYTLDADKVLMILRYPRYTFFTKTFCGDEAEMMLEEVLRNGYDTASNIIIKTYKRLEQYPPEKRATLPVLKEKFELLVKNQFLMRSICTPTISEIATDKPDFSLPNLNLKALTRLLQDIDDNPGDSKIYWRVNFDRFTQDLRDQVIILAATRRFDESAGELMRQLLYLMFLRTASWADTSNPIPVSEIRESVKKLDLPALSQYTDQYLCLIAEDSSRFIRRVGDAGGGQYSVNMKQAFFHLAWATLENIVTERFGSNAARIFRLVRLKKYIEQDQIQELAMIPAKQAKYLTYLLLQENYLQIQDLKKGNTTAIPAKVYFLFHIDLNLVVRMEIEHCYQALYNTILRREHEINVNRRMIDKKLRMVTLTSNLKEHGATPEQLAEIEEMMTPTEKLQLERVENMIKKIGVGELQIDETLFILTMYLRYH